MVVPGARWAKGPTRASAPTSALLPTVWETTARAPTTQSTRRVSGPISAPSPTVVSPWRGVPGKRGRGGVRGGGGWWGVGAWGRGGGRVSPPGPPPGAFVATAELGLGLGQL